MRQLATFLLIVGLSPIASAEEPGEAPDLALRGAVAWGTGVIVGAAGVWGALRLVGGTFEGLRSSSAPRMLGAALGPPLLVTFATTLVWTAGRRAPGVNAFMLSLGIHALAGSVALRLIPGNAPILYAALAFGVFLMPAGVIWQEDAEPRAPPPPRPDHARPITRSLFEPARATSFTLVDSGW